MEAVPEVIHKADELACRFCGGTKREDGFCRCPWGMDEWLAAHPTEPPEKVEPANVCMECRAAIPAPFTRCLDCCNRAQKELNAPLASAKPSKFYECSRCHSMDLCESDDGVVWLCASCREKAAVQKADALRSILPRGEETAKPVPRMPLRTTLVEKIKHAIQQATEISWADLCRVIHADRHGRDAIEHAVEALVRSGLVEIRSVTTAKRPKRLLCWRGITAPR